MKKITSILMLLCIAAPIIGAAMTVTNAHAQGDLFEVELQPDATSMKDAQIVSSTPTTNFGTTTNFGVGESNSSALVSRSLLEFDLSGLPSDATIVSATLSLWVDADQSDNARIMHAYPLEAEWTESQVTWNVRKTSTNWQTAGASGVNDASATSIGSVSLANNLSAGTQVDFTLDPSAVQAMLHQNYFGFKLQMETETNDRYLFKSSDNATAEERPMLTVEYYPDTPVPDPGWVCFDGVHGGELFAWEDCDSYTEMSPYMASGNKNTTNAVGGFIVDATAATLQCEPYPRCVNDYPIHYRIIYEAEWNKTGGSLTSTFHTDLIILGLPEIELTDSCGTGLNGSCFGVFEGTIPVSSLPVNTDGSYTVGVSTYFTWDGIVGGMTNREITWDVYFSLEPFDEECADTWFVPVPDTYEIDPTIDVPDGDPIDTQIYETVEDAEYMVHVKDGPWNDSVDDRTDAAVSINGGLTWYTWEEFSALPNVVCVDVDLENPDYTVIYFTATYTEFWIRANDTAGNFADNTNDAETPYSYVIGVAFELPETVACESQFTYDEGLDLYADINIPGTDDDVLTSVDELTPGDWYAITVTDGGWNEPAGAARTDMEFQFSGPRPAGLLHGDLYYPEDFTDLVEASEYVLCESADGLTMFVQAPAEFLHLRVNDQDDPYNFADNVGDLDVSIYHASFDRIESGCELQFQRGSLLDHHTVEGNQAEGVAFASYPDQVDLIYYQGDPLISIPTGEKFLVPGAWYAIETVEGPWYSTATAGDVLAYTFYYNMEIKVGDADWEPLETWSEAECVVETDALGHHLVFFQVPDDSDLSDDSYSLRVASNNFLFTKGYMAFDLYGAMDFGYTGATGSCDDYNFDAGEPHHTGSVNANSESGQYIPGLAVGSIYAIQIESDNEAADPPFFQLSGWFESNSSTTELDGLQLAVNGTDFQALPDANGVLCYYNTPVSDELVFFVRPQNGQSFKLRADSTTFANNTGREYFTVYEATASDSLLTWESCIGDYEMHIPPINPHEWIDVTKQEGELIASLAQYAEYNGLLAAGAELPAEIWKDPNSLGNYILEIEYGTGPWYDGETDTQHYGVELSNDGGVTWEELDADTSIVVCSTVDPLRHYWRALIHVEELGEVWMIRVADSATDVFADNTGNLAYILYTAGGFEVPPSDNSNIGYISVQGGGDVCQIAPVTPGLLSLTDIDELGNYFGGWIDYLNLSIMRYMAFCPRHTDMFLSVFDLLMRKEPFATLAEFGQLQEDIKRELKGYGWEGEGEDLSFIWGSKNPTQIQSIINTYVFEGGPNDPWADDGVLLSSDFGEPISLPSSYAACKALLPEYKRFAEGLCFSSSMMKETSAQFWIQLGFDVSMAILVVNIIWKGIVAIIAMATGVAYVGNNQPKIDVQVDVKGRR